MVKGKLRVYFGMAAGVGKTHRLMEEGRHRKVRGEDVVIGCLTERLASGVGTVAPLEWLPPGNGELDIEAVVARRPAVVLIDGLAHTNPSGSRNRKRFQDVLELLAKGIDVLTTVDLFSLESQADAVEGRAGVRISERVPDAVLELAEEVVLCDLAPAELLARYAEGKVSPPDLSPAAWSGIYQLDILTALREMTLLYIARLAGHRQTAHAGPPLRLLTAVSDSPNSGYLIRWTQAQASRLGVAWVALHVDSGKALSETRRKLLGDNLSLARQLGAEVVTIPSDDVPAAVIRYARANEVSQIVVGKSSPGFRPMRWFRRSLTDRLLSASGDIDVAVVKEKGRPLVAGKPQLGSQALRELVSLIESLAAILAVTGGGLALLEHIGYRSVSILYLLTIIGLAFWVSRPAILAAALLSAVLWDVLFIPPRFRFTIGRMDDILMFVLFIITALVLGQLMARLRANQRMLSVRERRLSLLFAFSQALSVKQNLDDIVRTGLEYLERHFEAEALLFLKEHAGGLNMQSRSLAANVPEPSELEAARWCFDHRLPCGFNTDSFGQLRYHFLPLRTPDSVVGVLGVSPGAGRAWLPDQEDVLNTLGRTLALSMERELLAETNRRNEMARESERLGKILLNTVSHELRTPLTAIKGSVTALMDAAMAGNPAARDVLLGEILEASDQLNGIVENLLSMSRLESGRLRLKKTPTDLEDVASVVVDSLGLQSADHPFAIKVEEGVPPVALDFVLLTQALVNLVQNAARHTPAGTPIELDIRMDAAGVVLTVTDAGPGVPPDELPRLFEPFFRGRGAGRGGVGLGLSICKGIVEAHGGRITAFINQQGGLSVAMTLPEKGP